MRRRHTREEYLDLVARIRETVPGIALSTDLIVGFPGETERGLRGHAVDAAGGADTTASSRSSTRRGRTRSRPSACPTTFRRRRRRAASWPAGAAARDPARAARGLVGSVVDVLVDSVSRRRDGEVAGRTGGNTVVNIAVPSDTAGDDAGWWVGRTVPVHVTQGGPAQPGGELARRGVDRGNPGEDAMLIEMSIKGLMVDPVTNLPIVILKDTRGRAGAVDLGRRLRGQRHRAPDRERVAAAADDPRPAAEPDRRSRRRGRSCGRVRPARRDLLRHDLPDGARASRSRSTPGPATRSRWRCAPRLPSSSRPRSSRLPRRRTSCPSATTTAGCRSGSRASTSRSSASTGCECRPADIRRPTVSPGET